MSSINKTIHKLNEGNKMKPESITNFQVFIYLQIILPFTGQIQKDKKKINVKSFNEFYLLSTNV